MTGKITKDLISRGHLGVVVQMGVDVAGGADVAVTQPFLDVLEGYPISIKERCAGVPEVVEPDSPHPVFFQKLRECLREIPRLDPLAQYVDIDIVLIVFAVAVSA